MIRKTVSMDTIARPLLFCFVILVSNMFSDFAWIIKLVQSLFMPELAYKIVLFFIHIAWVFFIIQYHALSLFLETLVDQHYKVPKRQWLFLSISFILCVIFIAIAILS